MRVIEKLFSMSSKSSTLKDAQIDMVVYSDGTCQEHDKTGKYGKSVCLRRMENLTKIQVAKSEHSEKSIAGYAITALILLLAFEATKPSVNSLTFRR